MNILKVKDVVQRLLIEQPETRDNDNLLILKVYAEYEPRLRNQEYRFLLFANQFLQGKFPNTESIRRSRQKLQEIHEGLRGENYFKRHKEQSNVKTQLKNF